MWIFYMPDRIQPDEKYVELIKFQYLKIILYFMKINFFRIIIYFCLKFCNYMITKYTLKDIST